MPPRDARPTKMYARTMRNGLVPKMSSRSEKNRFTDRAPVQPLTSSKAPASAARYAACSFRRRGSPGPGDSLNGLEILRVPFEVLPYGHELAVQARGDARLQVFRVQFPVRVRLCELVERLVDDIAAELRIPRDHQLLATREQNQPRNLEDRIADRLFRGAERFADLPLDLARAIVQEDARVRSGFRHLPRDEVHATAAIEGGQKRRMEGDHLFPPELRGHVAVQHVRVPLVHAAEREVQVHPMDVGDLHRRVDELRRIEVRLLLLPAHDRERPPDPSDRRAFRALDHVLPVLRMADELVRVQVFDRFRHADRPEPVLEVLRADAQILQIPPELVVDVRMPIREEDDRVKAGANEVSDLRSNDERGADVHQPGRLETHIRPRGGGPIEERPELVSGDDLLRALQDGLESVLRGHKPPNLRKRDKGFNPGTGRTAAIRQWP